MRDYLHGAVGLSPQETSALQQLLLEDGHTGAIA
jgi:hypothetical protein